MSKFSVSYRIKSNWKPVLWFVKGKYTGEHNEDLVRAAGPDKEFHEWGQDEVGFAALVDKFTYKGSTVCDPFLGGGTTAVVAVQQERKFIGCDISEECIEKTRARLGALK